MTNANVVENIVEQIKPLLAGQEPNVQGAVLADLLAMWLAGHAPQMREELFAFHVEQVRELVGVNEVLIFGEAGHPARRH
jgi:hypothetical protein